MEQYRIEAVEGGFEAQHLYNCGVTEGDRWFPLNAQGYWSDPDAYSYGVIRKRDVHPTREIAALAIARSRAICGTIE